MGEYASYLLRTKSRFESTTRVMLYDLPVLSKVLEDRRGRLPHRQYHEYSNKRPYKFLKLKSLVEIRGTTYWALFQTFV